MRWKWKIRQEEVRSGRMKGKRWRREKVCVKGR